MRPSMNAMNDLKTAIHTNPPGMPAVSAADAPAWCGVMGLFFVSAPQKRRGLGHRGAALHRLRRRHRRLGRPRCTPRSAAIAGSAAANPTHAATRWCRTGRYVSLAEPSTPWCRSMGGETVPFRHGCRGGGKRGEDRTFCHRRQWRDRGGAVHGRSLFAVAMTGKVQPSRRASALSRPRFTTHPFPCHCSSLDDTKSR